MYNDSRFSSYTEPPRPAACRAARGEQFVLCCTYLRYVYHQGSDVSQVPAGDIYCS